MTRRDAQRQVANTSLDELATRARNLLDKHGVELSGKSVVVGCSGGADSVVLVLLAERLGALPFVVHVNYGLRGSESEADEAFVRSLCASRSLPIEVVRFVADDVRGRHAASVQERARLLRYERLEDIATKSNASFVAVGHTLDDQSETLFLNLLRGTGADGIAGMPAVRSLGARGVRLVRPLLTTRRDEIENAARAEGVSWREDISNLSDAYARGRLRTTVIPAVAAAFGAESWLNLGRTANMVGEYVRSAFVDTVQDVMEICVSGERSLDIAALEGLPEVWRRRAILEALKRWCPDAPRSLKLIERIERLPASQVGRAVEHGPLRVVRARGELVFLHAHATPEDGSEPTSLEPGTFAPFRGRVYGCHRVEWEGPAELPGDSRVALIDGERLKWPLEVRRWRSGDRIHPLGAPGTRLVSDLLTDRKIPTTARDDVDVVVSSGTVVWCVGVEISDEVALPPEAERAVLLFRLDRSI